MVKFNKKAWHAGPSSWGELKYLNRYSIGIELVNAGKLKKVGGKWKSWNGVVIPDEQVIEAVHKNESRSSGWQVYPTAQIKAAIEVAKALHGHYKFEAILGHDDIAPTRKVDPGPAFPMQSFVSKVMGRK
jgi:N-acetylmuramoyl-L-alanine amidase